MYYHVVLKPKFQSYSECKTDLTKEQLLSRFVERYERGEPIFINGRTVNADGIERINFYQSEVLIAQFTARIRLEDLGSSAIIIGGQSIEERAIYRTTEVTDEFISGPPGAALMMQRAAPDPQAATDRSQVFIVHGHDGTAQSEAARFVEKLGLEAIILHEQPSSGRTIIEKIESYSNVGFGIVLYTPDDVGNMKAKAEELNGRARQNVVFEHGYLIGKIGRNKVVALVEEPIEIPGDMSGVVYIQKDEAGAWRLRVAKEMKEAGYQVDMNKL